MVFLVKDDVTGVGTTSSVMFIGELMKLSESYLGDGLHPRLIAEGFDLARDETVRFLDQNQLNLIHFNQNQLNPINQIQSSKFNQCYLIRFDTFQSESIKIK